MLLNHDQAKRDANIKKLTQETIPSQLATYRNQLSNEYKFLCGDQISIYDFQFAGLFVNLILNRMSNPEISQQEQNYWQYLWTKKTDQRTKKYVTDFQLAMRDYLEERKN